MPSEFDGKPIKIKDNEQVVAEAEEKLREQKQQDIEESKRLFEEAQQSQRLKDIVNDPSTDQSTEINPQKPLSEKTIKSIQGVPIDDGTRMDLYEMRNQDASSSDLGDYFNKLPQDEKLKLQKSGAVDGKGTRINDITGNETLDFPIKSSQEGVSDKSNTQD